MSLEFLEKRSDIWSKNSHINNNVIENPIREKINCIEKNSFFDEKENLDNDFEFNQDFEFEESTRSPGWIRYQKRIKWLVKESNNW